MVEEDENDVLEWVACVKQNLLVLCYLHDVKVSIYVTCVSDIIIKEIVHTFFNQIQVFPRLLCKMYERL